MLLPAIVAVNQTRLMLTIEREKVMRNSSPKLIAWFFVVVGVLFSTGAGVIYGQGRPDASDKPPVMMWSLDFSRDSSVFVAGGDAARVFDVKTGKLIQRLPLPSLAETVRFSPTATDIFATTGHDGIIRLWRVSQTEPLQVLKGHSVTVTSLAFSPDGRLIVSCGPRYVKGKAASSELRLWNVEKGELVQSLNLDGVEIRCVAISKDGKRLAFSKKSEPQNAASIEIYDLSDWQPQRSIPLKSGFALSVSFLPDGQNLVISGGECVRVSDKACNPNGRLWLVDVNSNQPAKLVNSLQSGYFNGAGLTPQGDKFVTAATTVKFQRNAQGQLIGQVGVMLTEMRKADTGEVVWEYESEIDEPSGATVSPDGKLVGCCTFKSVLILDGVSGRRIRSIKVDE